MNVSSSASIGNRSERSRKGGAWGFGLSPARPTAWQPEQFSVTSALPRAILSSALAVSPMLTANAIARPNSIGGILESVFNLCVMDKAGQLPRRATMATGHEKAQPYWDAGGRSLTQINAPSALPSRTAEPAVGDVRANFRFALRRADSGAAMPEQWETSWRPAYSGNPALRRPSSRGLSASR